MAEWLYEAGIGEARAALVEDGAIVEARIERDHEGPPVGTVQHARLIEAGKKPLVMLDGPGEQAVSLAKLPPGIPIGSRLQVEITREALMERGRDKLGRAKIADPDAAVGPGPDLRARIAATDVRVVDLGAPGPDRLEEAGWSEIVGHVRAGHWPFGDGALWVDATPAMVLIDIDGDGDPLALAKAGAVAAVRVIRCCDITGSIGIDFPSLASRADRLAIDASIDTLLPQPFERTAVNGFGLMQIIRRRVRPSLIEQIRLDPVATDGALLLRRAERAVGAGVLKLTAPPVVIDHIGRHPLWIEMLQRRTGRPVELIADAQIKGMGHAQ